MELTVDKFGRIVLPKALRQLLGLKPGKKVNIQIIDDGFIAKPVSITKPMLVKEENFLFVKYAEDREEELEENSSVDFDHILQEVREERVDKFLQPLL